MTIQSIEIQLVQQNTGHSQSSTSLKSRLKALLAPLQLLDRRLQQAIEVRQILLGTPFESYLLGSIAPGCSPAAAIDYSSPLAQLQRSFELSDFEIEVVLMAIAPELDRRYERLYARLQPNACRKPTKQLSLDVLCHSMAEKELARKTFSATAPLIRSGLIHLKASGSFSLNPIVSRHLLGQPVSAQVSTYCQLSWPQSNGRITNSPLLTDVLKRISRSNLSTPLTLNFSGQGRKEASARALAAAINRPLLTVDLSELLSDKLSDAERMHKMQQVALQGRLWNAVLYFEAPEELTEFQNPWFSSAIADTALRSDTSAVQGLLSYFYNHPGMVIFSAQSISSIIENSYTEVITIPFTLPYPDLIGIDPCLSRYLEPSHKPVSESLSKSLSETEWFRQKGLSTAIGFS